MCLAACLMQLQLASRISQFWLIGLPKRIPRLVRQLTMTIVDSNSEHCTQLGTLVLSEGFRVEDSFVEDTLVVNDAVNRVKDSIWAGGR